jgi:uncharacterized protein with FMN-binding domain
MRRLLIALASTAAGLAALLSFKTHSSVAGTTAAAPVTGTQGGSASASASTSAGSAGTAAGGGVAGSASPAPQGSTASSAATRGSTASSAATRTVTGAVASTQYGPMQVQVTLLGTKITGVKVLQQTNLGSLSQQIDANAIPKLNSETLAAQSARIDAVSGASYTSAGYIKSLQSALG